ncbi:hypothetical protein JQ625_13490 [Bradyrhizobium diazoefficiens]|nr:hypothetical protein [Bradyrhizobium diazoefficiens]MBR0775847.1 hypothetical protein [Bradyrhizobium diazoefficiens]
MLEAIYTIRCRKTHGRPCPHSSPTCARPMFARPQPANNAAARCVIDHLDGPGRFDALPSRQRDRITATAPNHVLDTRSGFDPTIPALRNILLPTRVVRGEGTARSLYTCADVLSRAMANASLHSIAGAGHFMTATHAAELAGLIGDHVMKAENAAWADLSFASPFGLAARSG